MKIRMLFMVSMVGLFFAASAGAFDVPGLGKSSSKAAGDPDAYLAKAQASEALVNKSEKLLFDLVASKKAQAEYEELQKAQTATTDPQEQKVIKQKMMESQEAEIQRAAKDKDLEAKAKGWSDQKKAQGAAALFNLALGALLAKDLIPEGQNLAKSMLSNPMMLTKANAIKESVITLGGIVTGTGKVLLALPPVFKAAKIKVELPKTVTEKEKETGDIKD